MIFQTENETKTWVYYKEVPWATEYGNIFSTLHDKNWQSSVNVTIWPTFRSGDVIDDVMGV